MLKVFSSTVPLDHSDPQPQRSPAIFWQDSHLAQVVKLSYNKSFSSPIHLQRRLEVHSLVLLATEYTNGMEDSLVFRTAQVARNNG